MGQRLSQKLKKEFEDYILFMEEQCAKKFKNCDSCKRMKQCQATSDKLINFLAESIK